MESIIHTIQIISSILLIVGILMQPASDTMEGALGSSAATYDNVRLKRRGFEKFIFEFTIVMSVLFVASFIAGLIV